MSMRDLPDEELDAWIRFALRSGASITPTQQQRAWEQLQRRVSVQAACEPDCETPVAQVASSILDFSAPIRRMASLPLSFLYSVLSLLLLEEHSYSRAREHRQSICYRDPFTISAGVGYPAFFYG